MIITCVDVGIFVCKLPWVGFVLWLIVVVVVRFKDC